MLDGIAIGQTLLRQEVHARFGGREQGGIGPSRKAPAVLFFTDPATGHKHGYYDGWDDEGLFNFVGEGQKGNQRLVQGNRALLDHVAQRRTLEGFNAQGTRVTYLGEFSLEDHYWTEAHESGDPTTIRQVVAFRLRPHAPTETRRIDMPMTPITRTKQPRVSTVDVEEQYTERAFVSPTREPYAAERREAALVLRYRDHLSQRGVAVSRLKIVPPGETVPLYSDLWNETALELVEAKGTGTRDEVRMAVGQLHDYGRFVEHRTKAILLPSRPRDDIRQYLSALGIVVIYEEGGEFRRGE